jgi:hypothetical protein
MSITDIPIGTVGRGPFVKTFVIKAEFSPTTSSAVRRSRHPSAAVTTCC